MKKLASYIAICRTKNGTFIEAEILAGGGITSVRTPSGTFTQLDYRIVHRDSPSERAAAERDMQTDPADRMLLTWH